MKKRQLVLLLLIVQMMVLTNTTVSAQSGDNTENKNADFKRHSIGSSLFLLGNIGDSVRFMQINYGYRLSPKDNIIAEAMTWTYYEPLGTYGSSEEFYPGKVTAYGIGLGYQRFWWKNLFTTIEPTFFLQQFYDNGGTKIQKGFQLYLQFIAGYRFEFFKKRFFIEPALALKTWPVNTNIPASFTAIDKGAPGYKFEPGLNFGFRF